MLLYERIQNFLIVVLLKKKTPLFNLTILKDCTFFFWGKSESDLELAYIIEMKFGLKIFTFFY